VTQQDVKNSSGHVLDHKIIGNIRGNFFVPAYQRGYRWTEYDVKSLLDDVWESRGEPYNLQPIVVKIHKQGSCESEYEWELIDGQQRLTTLYLILHYMKNQASCGLGAPYTLRYETRPGSEDYLNTLNEAVYNTNIDYYHLYQAYRCIDEWFQAHGDKFAQNSVASKIHGYLFGSVRVIWYQVAATPSLSQQEITAESIALFTRLNVGRIALTDAELIKAALLSAVRKHPTDRSHEIAAQWDGIERDLHQADIWAFVSGIDANAGDEKYPTRISLLLDTLADENKSPTTGKRPRYHTFDVLRSKIEHDLFDFWKKVVSLHAQILGWYEQSNIYNKIGFLVACKVPFSEVVQMATTPVDSKSADRKPNKSEFESLLVNRIRNHIKVKDNELEDLSYDDKKRGYHKLLELLLLMNVETSTCACQHFPFSRHVGQAWSLEHIHAQNADALTKAEQWKAWLEHQKPALDAVASEQNIKDITQIKDSMDSAIAAINAGKSGNFSGEKFNELSTRVLKILNLDDEPDHSIRNMALLSSRDNSSLSNSVFEVKRQLILALDRAGKYVPICTRNVFLKYYADADAHQPHFWSDKDKASYLKAIRETLKPSYLS
jgi:hypothetical protein